MEVQLQVAEYSFSNIYEPIMLPGKQTAVAISSKDTKVASKPTNKNTNMRGTVDVGYCSFFLA